MTARPVALSMFPDIAPDRPTGPLLGSVVAGTNADLIAAVAPLYLTGTVVDITFGRGSWWKRFRPEGLICHDIAIDGVDFRHLPEANRSIETVCFDPPYIPAGGAPTKERATDFRDRFGLSWGTGYRSQAELEQLILAGLKESVRVSSRWLLVKCMEFTASGFCDMPTKVTNWLADFGVQKHDQIVHHTGAGPGGHNIFTPKRARRHHSYLLVFEVSP